MRMKLLLLLTALALLALPGVAAAQDRHGVVIAPPVAPAELARQRPRGLFFTNEDFTVDNGMLTPTLKVKRRAVEQRHAGAIEQAYAAGDMERISTTVEL